MEEELFAGTVICNGCGHEQDAIAVSLAEIKHHERCDWCGLDDLSPTPGLMKFTIKRTEPKVLPPIRTV